MSADWNKNLTNLNAILAGMVPFRDEAYALALKAGLRTENIAFSNKPNTNWFFILQQAQRQQKLGELLAVIEGQFGESPIFNRARNDALDSILGPDEGKTRPHWEVPLESPDTLEKIIGRESTLLPIHFLESGLDVSRAVARIVTPAGVGTGFLTSGNLLVTNNHVIDQVKTAEQSCAEFNYQKNSRGLDMQPVRVEFNPADLFHTSIVDDWTIVRMRGNPNAEFGALPLQKTQLQKNQRVSIIQHPGGGEKQIALHHNFIRYADERIVQYLTDTLNGSSGSPVFDHNWKVVALHHAGGYFREPDTRRLVYRNEGIHINRVIDGIRASGVDIRDGGQA